MALAPAEKTWCGPAPANCDNCDRIIKDTFVDGRTKYGPWAYMCLGCARTIGIGLGIGKGQMYRRQEDNRWLKMEE